MYGLVTRVLVGRDLLPVRAASVLLEVPLRLAVGGLRPALSASFDRHVRQDHALRHRRDRVADVDLPAGDVVLAAVEFLGSNPSPSEEEIRIAISGNLCRCTGYQNIVKSIAAAAAHAAADGGP